MRRFCAPGLLAALTLVPLTGVAHAADMPPVKASKTNAVPACVTPGRLTAFLQSRNDRLDKRFDRIAVEYMRHGEALGLRWDYTFFQMLLETGNLSFRGDKGRRGDVDPRQNNFAGLGATGRGAPGESFPDVGTGVLAHLQHVLVYAGETVADPVADRTRKVQEWGILKSMQQRAKGTVTFAHLATKWAPGSTYVSILRSIAGRFHESFCDAPDPHPEWVAEARGETAKQPVANLGGKAAPRTAPVVDEPLTGKELAQQAIERGKADEDNQRRGLGMTPKLPPATAAAASAPSPSYSILNAPVASPRPPAPPAAMAESAPAPSTADKPPQVPAFATASAAGGLAFAAPSKSPPGRAAPSKEPPPVANSQKCRVWTASYGGQKAIIIKVRTDATTDYTVLDVNDGAETREAEAYIAAYAKGGIVEAEFASQAQALEKAFELCPED